MVVVVMIRLYICVDSWLGLILGVGLLLLLVGLVALRWELLLLLVIGVVVLGGLI
jgi:hypothetical protein